MKYTQGTIGRVFVIKFENEDVLLDKIKEFVKKEDVKIATITFLGALRKGDLVTGPKRLVIPPLANKVKFKDGWEVLGIGTIFTNSAGPQIHIHVSMGKANKVLTGCLRADSKVFLVIEAIVYELKGIKATKKIDSRTGLNLLTIP